MVVQVAQSSQPNTRNLSESGDSVGRRHVLTVNVEDYFQAGAFHEYIAPQKWSRFDSRLKQNVEHVLELLDQTTTKATFFVLGWIAENDPKLVQSIVDAGHEIASRGYLHQPLLNLDRAQIRDDVVRAKAVLEDVSGNRVDGFRLADGWIEKDSLWLLDELAAAGYRYDSSVMPQRRDFANEPEWRHVRDVQTPNGSVIEIPLTTAELPGGWLPIAGGNYLRQFPDFMMRRLVDRSIQGHTDPYVMYFQLWELDPEQPKLSIADRITKLRHYRKLEKYQRILPQYLERYDFTSIRDHASTPDSPLSNLKSDNTLAVPRVATLATPSGKSDRKIGRRSHRDEITIVIPCYNEESTLGYLANTLHGVTAELSGHYKPQVLFVDDCSTDCTADLLKELFADDPTVTIVRHETNRGVSAAILTGLQHATTDIVCSMDCDCSYDPNELNKMLPLLVDGVAMVTASPYHRDGEVRNVPAWRLLLSRGLSAIYQRLLNHPLATWTACFRVYRREDILDLPLQEDGFLGTAELAAQLVQRDRKIVEHPTTLEVRLFGFSKMKTLRAIASHLKLLLRIAMSRTAD